MFNLLLDEIRLNVSYGPSVKENNCFSNSPKHCLIKKKSVNFEGRPCLLNIHLFYTCVILNHFQIATFEMC